jgi:hypothetical protein
VVYIDRLWVIQGMILRAIIAFLVKLAFAILEATAISD